MSREGRVVMSSYCPVRRRGFETLLTLRKLLTAARSTAVVYSTIRLPTNPTQITDAMNQRYFVQMARWRLVHTNEDPPDRINRTPQHHRITPDTSDRQRRKRSRDRQKVSAAGQV